MSLNPVQSLNVVRVHCLQCGHGACAHDCFSVSSRGSFGACAPALHLQMQAALGSVCKSIQQSNSKHGSSSRHQAFDSGGSSYGFCAETGMNSRYGLSVLMMQCFPLKSFHINQISKSLFCLHQ